MLDKVFHTENLMCNFKENTFEGWYFKFWQENKTFAFIVGISTCKEDPHSFVQFIDENTSGYFVYGVDRFSFDPDNMTICIDGNTFSLEGIHFHSETVKADLIFSEHRLFKKTLLCPSAMGILGYLPNACGHAVISFHHRVQGSLEAGGSKFVLSGLGYIEKDFGKSFPGNYVWAQGQNEEVSVMFALAYPLIFGIKGFICLLRTGNAQHNFSLYTGAKLKRFDFEEGNLRLELTKKNAVLRLTMESPVPKNRTLKAPGKQGQMNVATLENLCARMEVELTIGENSIKASFPCAFESFLQPQPVKQARAEEQL